MLTEDERSFRAQLRGKTSEVTKLEPWPTAEELRDSRAKLPDPEVELRELSRELPIAGLRSVSVRLREAEVQIPRRLNT